jgi:anti-sigma regulatory factor (Ser/Thr protein kinase)
MIAHAVHPVLRVPAEASFVSTVRIFAGAIGRQAGLQDERIDDLKLVVSEVAAELIGDGRHGPHGVVVVEVEVEDATGTARVTCRGPAPSRQDGADPAADHRRRLLEAIVPDTTWTRVDDEQLVSFSVGP